MGAIADKKLGDFLPTIDAYRPVALTVAAILGLVVVLPGAERNGAGSPLAGFAAASSASGGTPSEIAGVATADEAPAPVGRGDEPVVAPAVSPFRPSPPMTSPSSASPRPSAPAPAAGGSAGRPTAPPSASPSVPDDAEGEPLQIVASGWASTTGGTPIATGSAEGIEEGTLPVGARVGQTDKVSFVRLRGDGSVLVLAEEESGRRGSAVDAPPVQLCQITQAGWESGGDQAMSDAPEHDPEACVPGRPQPGGTWAFSLVRFDPADERGFALVPTDDAPLDFQVTFVGQAVG